MIEEINRRAELVDRVKKLARSFFDDGYTLGEISWALQIVARDWRKAAEGENA